MAAKMRILFYQTENGNSPIERYLDQIDDEELGRVLAILNDIAMHGLDGPSVVTRQIHAKLWELKIRQLRFFYMVLNGPRMVILHACKKQSARARGKDIDTAKRRLAILTA